MGKFLRAHQRRHLLTHTHTHTHTHISTHTHTRQGLVRRSTSMSETNQVLSKIQSRKGLKAKYNKEHLSRNAKITTNIKFTGSLVLALKDKTTGRGASAQKQKT